MSDCQWDRYCEQAVDKIKLYVTKLPNSEDEEDDGLTP